MNTTKVLGVKILSVAALATAFALAPMANAQAFGVGVRFDRPAYVRVAPSYPVARFDGGYDYRVDRRDFDRHEAFIREQAWRDREFREHRDFDRRHFDDHHRW
jgi:hypothetical protein